MDDDNYQNLTMREKLEGLLEFQGNKAANTIINMDNTSSITRDVSKTDDLVSNISKMALEISNVKSTVCSLQSQQASILQTVWENNMLLKNINEKGSINTGTKSTPKRTFHLSDEQETPFDVANNEDILLLISDLRENYFSKGGYFEIKDQRLKNFLDDKFIKQKALEYFKDAGKFCKFVADILIPQESILKFYFPSLRTRRPKEQMFSETIVNSYYSAAKYLGSGIILEEKE